MCWFINTRNAALRLALSAALLVSTALPAMAAGRFDESTAVGVGIQGPIYSSNPSEQKPTGQPQFSLRMDGREIWRWDAAKREYPGVLPTGVGLKLRVYPNVDFRLPISNMAVMEAEASAPVVGDYDKRNHHNYFRPIPGLTELCRDEIGRYFCDIDLSQGGGPHCLRFYYIAPGACRKDETFLIFFHRAGKSAGSDLVDTLRFETEPWPSTTRPTAMELVNLLRRAGNGGNGLVFESLLTSDAAQARMAAEAAARTNATMAKGGETTTVETVVTPPSMPTAPPPAPREEAVQPQSIDFNIVFVRDNRTACWEVDDVASVSGRIGAVPVYFQYAENGKWVNCDHLRSDRHGVLRWENGVVGSCLTLRASFQCEGHWQVRTFNVTSATHVVVVPMS